MSSHTDPSIDYDLDHPLFPYQRIPRKYDANRYLSRKLDLYDLDHYWSCCFHGKIRLMDKNKRIVYSCSGCSTAAQMANYIAIKVDRQKIAEMSCIAGVGGDVASLVSVAKSGREIITIDGCPLKCCQACLKRHGVLPSESFVLSEFKVKKRIGEDFDKNEAEDVYNQIEKTLLRKLE